MSNRLMRPQRRSTPLIFILSSLLLIAAGALFIIQLAAFAQSEDRLAAGLSVGKVPVGGLTPEQAQSAWEQAYSEPVVLFYQDSPILLNPDSIGFQLNSASMLAEAVSAGEQGSGFWGRFLNYMLGLEVSAQQDIPAQFDYQRTALEALLQDIAARYDNTSAEANYDLQTLTTFTDTEGYQLNVQEALPMVDAALRSPDNRVVSLPVESSDFARPGLSALRELIIAYLDAEGFLYDSPTSVASVYIQDLTTGEEMTILGDVAYTAASTIKVGILIDYFRVLNREPNDDDKFLMANSLLCSANSTSNLIMRDMLGGGDQFVGIASVSNTLQYIGARNSYLSAPFVDGSPDQQFGSIQPPETSPNPSFDTEPDPYNQTTPEDLGTAFSMIYDCAEYGTGLATAYPNGEITPNECQMMLELMSANDLERLLQGGIPQDVRISHKNGWFGETVGEAGVVFPPNGRDYVISVFLWEDAEDGFQDHLTLWPLVEGISRAAWNYFAPEEALLNPRENLPQTARECFTTDANGERVYNYLPPYGQVDLTDINGWREGDTQQPITQPPEGLAPEEPVESGETAGQGNP